MLGILLRKQFQASRGSELPARVISRIFSMEFVPSAPHGLGPAGCASALCLCCSTNPCTHAALLCPTKHSLPKEPSPAQT